MIDRYAKEQVGGNAGWQKGRIVLYLASESRRDSLLVTIYISSPWAVKQL